MTEPRPGVDPATNEMRRDEALTEVVQLRTDRAYWKSLTAARTKRVNALEAEVVRLRGDLAAAIKGRADSDDLADMFRDQRDQAEADLADAQRGRDAWQELAEARSELLACYRIGKHPSERLLRRLDIANEGVVALSAGGTDQMEGDDSERPHKSVC